MKADVCLRNNLKYDRELLKGHLSEMIEITGGWPEPFSAGARILIKINLLAAKGPEKAITTHPEVVGALVELLQSRGCHVTVGDSPGGAVKGVERYWRNCGFLDLASELGFELVNFERAGSIPRKVGGTTYHVAKAVYDYDAIINACKFKTHMLCRLTNAVKNSYGIIPGLAKAVIHSYSVRPVDFAVHVVNVFEQVKFDLVVSDAILAMDGKGPSTDGNPRHEGLLAVARDSVVMDMVFSNLVGLPPEDLDTTREARKRGLGKPWDEIIVDGSHQIIDFNIPQTSLYNLVPPIIGTILRPFLKKVPASNEKCNGCGFCANSCPVDAITFTDKRARMDHKSCILCLCCHELCPENAIDLKGRFQRGSTKIQISNAN